ncbi:MAG TPA: hypothetical protein VKV26_02715 [Dehalococcoidia bacterium]|nr:hypothetical protein [Dehalococcoidia bacterium]
MNSTTTNSVPAPPDSPPADGAVAGAPGDPLLNLRDRIAADGSVERRWRMPRLGSPALWLLDEPLLFGAVLVAVLLLGLALGARLFHSQDTRRLIVPTVVVQQNPPAPTVVRAAPATPPAVSTEPTVAPAPAAPAARPAAPAPAAAAPQAATAATPAGVPPPAAGSAPAAAPAGGSSLSNIVGNAARQPAPAAGVPPPAAGFPVGGGAATGAGSAGAAAGGSAARTSQPPDLDAAFENVVTQGRRAATAAAQRGPAPAQPAAPQH